MNVLLIFGIFWTVYGIAGLFGWQRINDKYKGYDWTKKYIRCLGISWLMLGIPVIAFSKLHTPFTNESCIPLLLCMLPSIIFAAAVEKKFNAKVKDTKM